MNALLVALALAEQPGPEALLQAGQFRLVAAAATQVLAERPDDLAARSWLARAQAGLERCTSAREELAALRPTPVWSAGLAVAEGRCAAIAGAWADAEVAYEEAVRLDPSMVRAWMGLAEVAGARGDLVLLERSLAELAEQRRAPHAAQMARADLAQRYDLGVEGELMELRRTLHLERSRETAAISLALTEAREWLRAGDPSRAYDVLEPVAEGHYTSDEVGAWLGEASRRLGWRERAAEVFESTAVARSPRAGVRILRARWLIDIGQLDAAAAELEATHGQHAPLWVATRWYLARARNEDGTPWEDAWGEVPPGYGSLEQLVPATP